MPDEIEEIEVTQLIERIESVEKENSAQKEKIGTLEGRIRDLEESLDELAAKIRKG